MVCLVAALSPWPAMGQEASPERGRAIAERWCASCHVVGPDAPGGDAGPSFETVATVVDQQEAALKAWLAAPHDPMPDFNLSPKDIADIIAHIRTLRP